MNTICRLPYFEVEVDKSGNLVDPVCLNAVVPAANLFAFAHGWNSDMSAARALYENFFNRFCRTLEAYGAPGVTAGQCAVMGILWPSEKYADPASTPGGAAGIGNDLESLRRALTYRLMKNRAGIVGRGAVASALDRIQRAFPDVRVTSWDTVSEPRRYRRGGRHSPAGRVDDALAGRLLAELLQPRFRFDARGRRFSRRCRQSQVRRPAADHSQHP